MVITLSKMFKNDSKFTIFDTGYPIENVQIKNDSKFTFFDRGYPIENVQK